MAAGVFKSIRLERRDGIMTILLDRPDRRNAMSAGMVSELSEAIAVFDGEDDFRVMVLAGSGAGFCAGSDLRGLADMADEERCAFEADSGRVARMISESAKPVVAAVHGFAVGGGLTLAIAADIVVTEAAARWSLPEVPIGLFPAWGMGPLVRRAGTGAARRLAWGLDVLDGVEAKRTGLADTVVQADALPLALEIAERLSALPRQQAMAVKRFFAAAGDEASDVAANAAFMATTALAEAQASFARFATPKTG